MKVSKASYMDDGVTVPGILVKRFLRKPVFYAADPSCGWNSQAITKAEQGKVVNWIGEPRPGKSRCFCNTEGAAQSSDDMYRKAIQATIASGKAAEILNSEKAQALSASSRLEFDIAVL